MFQSKYRSSYQRYSVKKVFLDISQNSQENNCARVSFLIKLETSVVQLYYCKTLAQVFSCEFCKIFKNTFSYRTPFLTERLWWLFTQILLLVEQVRILKLENEKLQEERKAQLNIVKRLTENQNSDFRKETGNDWTTVRPKKKSKGLSSRQNTILELQNLHSLL